ncbi:MAG: hypothetical protein J2P25_09705 [Nocardiopsaceae bacterium]|nr:hypothetical protein [Nocardiopsaceae bacterium]
MPERQLRRHCRGLLRDLGIRPPLDVGQLCARLGEHRGKPIRLRPAPIPVPGPFGIWIAVPGADHILFQQETTRAHQDHIILHEVGHIIARHGSDEEDAEILRALYPDVDPEMVRRMTRRTSYETAQEREAETVATIILQWASVLDPLAPRFAATATGRRMHAGLGDRVGWM